MIQRQFTQRLPAFEGVAAGQTATIKLPMGNKYHAFYFAYAGVTVAQLDEIRVVANGKVVQRFTGTERDTLNQFDGLAAAGGIFTIPFDRVGMKTRVGNEETAFNTAPAAFRSLNIEIDINAAAAAPALTAPRAQVSVGDPSSIGTILHIGKFSRASAGAGDVEISDLPYGKPSSLALNRIHFNLAGLTNLKLEVDQYTVFDRSTTLNSVIQTDGVRTPQAAWFSIDPTERGYSGDVIPMIRTDNGVQSSVNDFRYTVTTGGAGTIVVLQEVLGALGD